MIAMYNISKTFPGTKALDKVDFELQQGEILSLLGENGAGKTTLMKVLYGMELPDEGEIFYQGNKIQINKPSDAINIGICMVHQHFMLVPAFTVVENIIAGNEPKKGVFLNKAKAYEEVSDLIHHFKFNIDPNTKVSALSVGEQQRVEILKALYRKAKVLILDEPSAVLTPTEVDELFVTLRLLRSKGTSIVIITHKLKETMSIADRIVVLRNGRIIRSDVRPSETNVIDLSEMMVGRAINMEKREPSKNIGEINYSVENLIMYDRGIEKLRNISLYIKKGEILGVAGVEGNGQTQLLEALTGLKKPASMELKLNGKHLAGGAHEFLQHGIGHVPEDRSTMGLVTPMSIKENIILGYHDNKDFCNNLLLKWKYIKEYAEKCRQQFQIKAPSVETPTRALSGGNQQKIVMARTLSRDLEVLIVAHPTRGLDIGSSEYIHQQILNFRNKGKSVLLVSADLDEVVKLSDRLVVLYDGRIVTECKPDRYTKVQLGLLMTGNPLSSVEEEQNEKPV